MIQIQSGIYKGKKINVPNLDWVKPTKHIVRSAVFNMLRHRVHLPTSGFCDVFAGSGIMGFEALSNGCSPVYFYDVSTAVCRTLTQAATHFGEHDIIIKHKNALEDIPFFMEQPAPMIFYLDPPYAEANLITRFMERLSKNDAKKNPSRHIFIETDKDLDPDQFQKFTLIQQKQYGLSKLYFFGC